MREIDAAPIRQKLGSILGPQKQHQAWLNLIERWRERLLADETAFTDFLRTYPQADSQRLRLLVRNIQHEEAISKPPKIFRALFKELQELIPQPHLDK